MMKRRLLTAGGIVAAVVIVLIIVMSLVNDGNDDGRTLRTATVQRGSIIVKVTESGEVEPLTTVNIKSELAGEVKKLFVEEGDSVSVDDRLALVQQESSQAQQVAQARASLERANLDLVDAERHLVRQRGLYEKGFIAEKDVEDAEQAYRRSQIECELAEKKLWLVLGGTESVDATGIGAKSFDNILVQSPISGVVLNMNVEEGEMITSGTQAYGGGGTVLMTIADLSKMIVKADINEVDVSRVRVGQAAQIGFDAIRDRVYRGVVRKIAPAGLIEGNIVVFPVEVEIIGSVAGEFEPAEPEESPRDLRERMFSHLPDEQRDAVRSEIQSLRAQGAGPEEIRRGMEQILAKYGVKPPEDRPRRMHPALLGGADERSGIELIKPGMTADLDIIIAAAEDVLVIPKEAVTEQDGDRIVMAMKEGKPVRQPVVVGLENDVNVEIREGLEEGDKVVSTPFQALTSQQSERSGFRGPPM